MMYGPNPKFKPPKVDKSDAIYREVTSLPWLSLLSSYAKEIKKRGVTKKTRKMQEHIIGAGKGLAVVIMTDLCNVGNLIAAKKLFRLMESDEDLYLALPTLAEYFTIGEIVHDTFNLKHVLMSDQYYTGEVITDVDLLEAD